MPTPPTIGRLEFDYALSWNQVLVVVATETAEWRLLAYPMRLAVRYPTPEGYRAPLHLLQHLRTCEVEEQEADERISWEVSTALAQQTGYRIKGPRPVLAREVPVRAFLPIPCLSYPAIDHPELADAMREVAQRMVAKIRAGHELAQQIRDVLDRHPALSADE